MALLSNVRPLQEAWWTLVGCAQALPAPSCNDDYWRATSSLEVYMGMLARCYRWLTWRLCKAWAEFVVCVDHDSVKVMSWKVEYRRIYACRDVVLCASCLVYILHVAIWWCYPVLGALIVWLQPSGLFTFLIYSSKCHQTQTQVQFLSNALLSPLVARLSRRLLSPSQNNCNYRVQNLFHKK